MIGFLVILLIISVVSVARMKRTDNLPSGRLTIPKTDYFRRLQILAVHEVGHDVVRASHHKEASWVNIRSGRSLSLGSHCGDNTCSMYEVVDVQSPPGDEGYLITW